MTPQPLGTATSFISRSQTGLQAVVARPVTKFLAPKRKTLKLKRAHSSFYFTAMADYVKSLVDF